MNCVKWQHTNNGCHNKWQHQAAITNNGANKSDRKSIQQEDTDGEIHAADIKRRHA